MRSTRLFESHKVVIAELQQSLIERTLKCPRTAKKVSVYLIGESNRPTFCLSQILTTYLVHFFVSYLVLRTHSTKCTYL